MKKNPDNQSIKRIGAVTFEADVLRARQPVLVMFWAPWSRPCQIMASVMNEVAAACMPQVRVFSVNADDNPDLGLLYEVQSIPTLLYFVNGAIRDRIVGTASKDAILARLVSLTRPEPVPSHPKHDEEQ